MRGKFQTNWAVVFFLLLFGIFFASLDMQKEEERKKKGINTTVVTLDEVKVPTYQSRVPEIADYAKAPCHRVDEDTMRLCKDSRRVETLD